MRTERNKEEKENETYPNSIERSSNTDDNKKCSLCTEIYLENRKDVT